MVSWSIPCIVAVATSPSFAARHTRRSRSDAGVHVVSGVRAFNIDRAASQRSRSFAKTQDGREIGSWMAEKVDNLPDAYQRDLDTLCGANVQLQSVEQKCACKQFDRFYVKFEHCSVDDMNDQMEKLGGEAANIFKYLEPDVDTDLTPELDVFEDGEESALVQTAPPTGETWGLKVIGARKQSGTGRGVHVYVLDTGIRTSHTQFAGRAIPTLEVVSDNPKECKGDSACAKDIQGHGTHCAGTVAGKDYGVAVNANLHAMKILANDGRGHLSWVLAGMDWVVENGQRPGVLSMSLGGPGIAQSEKAATDRLTTAGFTVVVAAGNQNADACNFSPAFVGKAITVGAIDSTFKKAWYSNWGKCVDIWGPGSDVKSAGVKTDSWTTTQSGTSMACPHVSGAVALLMEANPTIAAADVMTTLKNKAFSGKISGDLKGAPNLELNVGPEAPPEAPPSPPEAPPEAPNECVDKAEYIDAMGFECSDWQSGECVSDSTTSDWGYSDADVLEVRRNCKQSCGLC